MSKTSRGVDDDNVYVTSPATEVSTLTVSLLVSGCKTGPFSCVTSSAMTGSCPSSAVGSSIVILTSTAAPASMLVMSITSLRLTATSSVPRVIACADTFSP